MESRLTQPAVFMDHGLMKAVVSGDVDHLVQLLDQNNSLLEEVTPVKNTALHVAVRYGQEHLLREIYCRRRALLMMENSKGDTPLHLASRAGNLKIVQQLLEFAKTFNDSGLDDCENGGIIDDERAVAVLKKQNCQLDTPLHEAVMKGHLGVVKVLLGADSQVSCMVNRLGKCPFYLAVERGWLNIIHELLQRPNKCDHGGPNGRTALHTAVFLRNYGVKKILIEKVPDLLKKSDVFGRTALHYAVSVGLDNKKTVPLLLRSEPSAAYQLDKDGVSPLHIAAALGNTNFITLFVKHCRDCGELLDNRGRNALHFAVQMEKLNSVKLILKTPELKHMVNEGDNEGNTPLHHAAINSSFQILQRLIGHKEVDLWVVNNDGFTACQIAMSKLRDSQESDLAKIQTRRRLARARAPTYIGKEMRGLLPPNKEAWEARRHRYKNYAKDLTVVAALITTVTFGAAFTLPGGFNNDGPDKGIATLASKAAFKAFLIFDTIAMCSSIALLILLIPVINLSGVSLCRQRNVANLLRIALLGMLVAFVMGVYVVVAKKLEWLAISMGIIIIFYFLYHKVFFAEARFFNYRFWTMHKTTTEYIIN